MKTNADIAQELFYNSFSGRTEILEKIRCIVNRVRTTGGPSIINLYGIGGIGKTSIFQYISYTLEAEGIPSASVDFDENNLDIFDIIFSFYASLVNKSVNSAVAFADYVAIQEEMKKVEKKLLKQLKKTNSTVLTALLSTPIAETMQSAGSIAGKTVSDILVPTVATTALSGILIAAGGVVGALAGAGIGLAISKITEHRRQDCITALNQVGLNRNEIQTFLHYKENLVSAFINGVNKLVEDDASLILCFDTFEKVPTHISQWLREALIPSLSNKIVVFICGKEKITNAIFWKEIGNIINMIPVSPFSPIEAEQYLEKSKIHTRDRIDWIIKITGCLPWALALAVDFINESETLDAAESQETFDEDKIGEQVVARFLNHIDDEYLKSAIYLCALTNYFTHDLLMEYFSSIKDTNRISEIYRKIRDFSFTKKLDSNKYVIQDVVSGFLLKKLKRFNVTEYKQKNIFFCSYYQNLIDKSLDIFEKSKYQWEYIYHYINIDEIAALELIDKFLVDTDPCIPLDIFEDYLYSGLKNVCFATNIGKLYNDFSTAQIYYTTGNWPQSIELFEKTLLVANANSRFAIIACSTLTLADIYLGQGYYIKAKNLFEQLLQQTGAPSSLRKKKKVRARLNEVYAILGHYGKGEKLALESKAESEKERDSVGIAWACKSLGDIYRLWGKQEKAISILKEGLTLFISKQDTFGEAVVRTQLARNLTHIGKWEDAESELDKSEIIYDRYGYKYGMANVYLFRANILRLKHQWDESLKHYEKAFELHKRMQSWREISPIWGSMGLIYYYLGDKEKSNLFFEKSINLKQQQRYIRGVMISKMYVGDCLFMDNEWKMALASYNAARSVLGRTAKPIYVCAELELKIFLCRLANNELNEDEINMSYLSIKKIIIKYKYNHLVSLLEYHYCKLKKDLSCELFKLHIDICMEFAKKYNNYLKKYYYSEFEKLINERFSDIEKETLEKKLQRSA